MTISRRLRKKHLAILFAVALPVALYLVAAARVSWIPRTFVVSDSVTGIAFSPDGNTLAVGHYRRVELKKTAEEEAWNNCGQLELWDVRSRHPILAFAHNESEPVERLTFGRTPKTLIYMNQDGRVRCLNLSNNQSRVVPGVVCKNFPLSFALSPDSQQFSIADKRTIRSYNISNGSLVRTFATPLQKPEDDGSMDSLQYSQDGSILCARLSYDSSFHVFDARTGKSLSTVVSNTGFIEEGSLAPDGKTLALSGGKFLRLYDFQSHASRQFPIGPVAVRCIAWSPDSNLLAVGNLDGLLRLWDVRSGKLLHSWAETMPGGFSVDHLAFSPDSRTLASATSLDRITLRRVQ